MKSFSNGEVLKHDDSIVLEVMRAARRTANLIMCLTTRNTTTLFE